MVLPFLDPPPPPTPPPQLTRARHATKSLRTWWGLHSSPAAMLLRRPTMPPWYVNASASVACDTLTPSRVQQPDAVAKKLQKKAERKQKKKKKKQQQQQQKKKKQEKEQQEKPSGLTKLGKVCHSFSLLSMHSLLSCLSALSLRAWCGG